MVEELTDLDETKPAALNWPNDAILAPEGMFDFRALIVPQGFVHTLPGRLSIINLDDIQKTEYLIHQSTQFAPRFHHTAVFFDMDGDGLLDIVTVRTGFCPDRQRFHPPIGEMVWFRNPGPDSLDPHLPWNETVLVAGDASEQDCGPDVDIAMFDFEGDGVPEFVATHFFGHSQKIALYGAPAHGNWSCVNARDPDAAPPRIRDISSKELGRPFNIEVVDLNGDSKVEILVTNHQTINDTIAGRVMVLEPPKHGDIFSKPWRTRILLDGLRPAPDLLGRNERAAPGHAVPIFPCLPEQTVATRRWWAPRQCQPWLLVSGDQAGKVWLMKPRPWKSFSYTTELIFDIDEVYGSNTTQTVGTGKQGEAPRGLTISSIGRPVASWDRNDCWTVFVPVFEAAKLHILRVHVGGTFSRHIDNSGTSTLTQASTPMHVSS